MKTGNFRLTLGLFAAAILASSLIQAQSITSLPATIGTVARHTPDSLSVNMSGSNTPLVYSYTKATTFMDAEGNTVATSEVQAGVPVAVFFESEDNKLIARKIVVGATTVSSVPTSGIVSIGKPGEVVPAETGIPRPNAGPWVETASSTQPVAGMSKASSSTSIAGVVVWVGTNEIQLKNQSSAAPIAIGYDSSTTYVSDKGNPVSRDAIIPGQQVTVQYGQVGATLLASQVMLRTEVRADEPASVRDRSPRQGEEVDGASTTDRKIVIQPSPAKQSNSPAKLAPPRQTGFKQ